MSFDTFTIVGILSALISGGFLVALVSRNDIGRRQSRSSLESRPAKAVESNS